MSRNSRRKDISRKDGEVFETEVYDGSAARTRPLSIEDILIRRKNKRVNAGAKDGSVDLRNLSGQVNGNNLEHDRGYRQGKESSSFNGKKDTESTTNRSSRGEEAAFSKERGSVKGGDRKRHDVETKSRRVDKESDRVNKHKDEKESYHRSKKEEHKRDDKETSELKREWKSPNRSRNDDRWTKEMVRDKDHEEENLPDKDVVRAKEPKDEKLRDKVMVRGKEHKDEKQRDKEIGRAKEHKDEKQDDEDIVRTQGKKDGKQRQYRKRNDKHETDESDTKKEHIGELAGKDTFLDSEMVESERESRKKHWSREEGRDRAELGGSAVKKDDSNKYTDSAEMRDRNKGTSKPHYEGSGRKRRRSRSREFRARDRSVSLSPRGHKRVHEGWEHGESSLHSLKDRKQDSDVDRNRVSSNTAQTSNHSRHHGGHGNRLGGYSPRRRRSEAGIRSPSPPARSSEKKTGRWDLPTGSATMPADLQLSHQTVAVNHNIFNGVSVVPKDVRGPLSADLISSLLVSKPTNVTVDPVQLTQATRPLRTLYVENLPASASDKSVIECLNNFLMSSRANHLQGTQPCISCNINKEKGQALVEFLTAEDATTALSFDGRPFSGSVLKFRRPKDFVNATTGVAGKSVPAVETISDIVNDSPHKIYIGGISKALSSDILMEIVSAFGRLKAYHFVVNDDLKQPSAFIEYEDKAITSKACAGLNGMKLGGQVLTVLQAFPSLSLEENTGNPFYGIPEHAKPLLSEPTKVLKLKNVLNAEDFSLLSGSELEEILEDIRIECARFGTVKSVNYIKFEKKMAQDTIEGDGSGNVTSVLEEASISVQEPQEDDERRDIIQNEDTIMDNVSMTVASDGDIIPKENANMTVEDDLKQDETTEVKQEESAELKQEEITELKQEETTELKDEEITELKDEEMTELKDVEITELKQEEITELNDNVEGELEGRERVEIKEEKREEDEIFEQGCVFVEYVRSEASCIAAHSLHGRLYGECNVSVGYIPHDLYLSRFPK